MIFTLSHLNNFEQLYKYGKLKGWMDIAPSFKTNKPVDKEKLSVSLSSIISGSMAASILKSRNGII